MGTISSFASLPYATHVYVATTATHRWTAIRLRTGSLCLVSSLSDVAQGTIEELNGLGPVSHLFAPTRFHHAAEHASTFPNAKLCASETAAQLLHKVTGKTFDNTSELAKLLPSGASLVEPDGLKTGEAWIRVKTAKGTGWIVGDAIAGQKMTKTSSESPEPAMLKTFPTYGIRDAVQYKSWATAQIALDQPTFVVPCHGTTVVATDLPAKLSKLMKAF